MHYLQASHEMLEMVPIGMDARLTATRHGLSNIFEDTQCFSDHSHSDDPCHKIHIRLYAIVVLNDIHATLEKIFKKR